MKLNTKSVTVKVLQDVVLKGSFGMVAPDVEIDDGKGAWRGRVFVSVSVYGRVSVVFVCYVQY